MPNNASSKQQSFPGWRTVLKVCVLWAGANVLTLWLIDVGETIQLSKEHDVPYDVLRSFRARTIELDIGDSVNSGVLAYRLRKPAQSTERHGVPLLVFLHGSGQRGYDNAQQLRGAPALMHGPLSEQYPCALLAPQCPDDLTWSSRLTAETSMIDAIQQMLDVVLEDDQIDPHRIYLVGYSMGGFGAWPLAAQTPDRFAAVIPIAGGASPSLASQLTLVPIWAVHSVDDEVVSVEGTRAIVDAIREAGGDPNYLELTDAGHGAWKRVFVEDSALLNWMFQQRLDAGH